MPQPFDFEAYKATQNSEAARQDLIQRTDLEEQQRRLSLQSQPGFVQHVPTQIPGRVQQTATTGTVQQANQQAVDPVAHLEGEMRRITSMPDGEEKFLEITKLRGSVEGMLAEFRGGAHKQAASEFQVQSLQQSLAENEAADKADENYALYQADSDMTRQVRAQYDAALTASRMRGETIFQNNPTAQKIAGMMAPFLDYQMTMMAKKEGKEAEREAKAQALADQFGTGHLELAGVVAPGGDNVQTAAREYKNLDFREAAMAMNSPTDLIPMALSEGNVYAKKGLVHKQAVELSGTQDKNSSAYKQAEAIASKDYKTMNEIASNDASFQTALKTMIPNKAKRDQILSNYTMLGQTASGEKERRKIRADYAPVILADLKKQEFLGNVAGWKGSEALQNPATPIGKVYSTVQSRLGVGQEISLQALAYAIKDTYLKDPQSMAAARDELLGVAQKAKKEVASGIYGNFGDSLDMRIQIDSMLAEAPLLYTQRPYSETFAELFNKGE